MGAIVHVYELRTGHPQAYIVEVSLADGAGVHADAYLFDVTGDEIEPATVTGPSPA